MVGIKYLVVYCSSFCIFSADVFDSIKSKFQDKSSAVTFVFALLVSELKFLALFLLFLITSAFLYDIYVC